MFPYPLYSRFECGDMVVLFFRQKEQMLFSLLPKAMEKKIPGHHTDITDTTACRGLAAANRCRFNSLTFENMLQCHVQGDAYGWGYYPGESMIDNETARTLEFVSQEQRGEEIRTVMRSPKHGLEAVQIIRYRRKETFLSVHTELTNTGKTELNIDQLLSFQLGMVSPFAEDDGPDRYKIHRYAAYWGAEGRHVVDSAESLGLERAWVPFVGRAERFGQRSTLAVKRYFPTLGLEDARAKVIWGVQLAVLGPWQLEVSRKGDFLNLAGGFPDGEFSGWMKKLRPGETVVSPEAVISVTRGSMDHLLSRLTSYQENRALHPAPAERELPAMFNEYCTSWGKPDSQRLYRMADILKESGIRYFIMDAGWFRDETMKAGKGDWQVSSIRFPEGMKAYCEAIRGKGLIPGIWFEFEQVATKDSVLGQERPDLMLKLHGEPHLTGLDFAPLDFRKKEVRDLMHKRVIEFLRDNGFGYMKVDYNVTVSGADTDNGTPMEGVREYLNAVEEFFRAIKTELPDLVLEICASGGHRLTAAWMTIGDMGSFSDDHEDISIPLVAAGTARQIALSRNQVWAVLHDWDDERRLCYSLAAGLMGRLCLSGDLDKLSPKQFAKVQEALDFARGIVPLIREGETAVEQRLSSESWLHPQGVQIFRRSNAQGEYLVIHHFDKAPKMLTLPVKNGLRISRVFGEDGVQVSLRAGKLRIQNPGAFSGLAVCLERSVSPDGR